MASNRNPGQKDKRSKLDLELFLLALLQRGINTPYSLHANAGLSPGATIPVLKRLSGGGYVQRGNPGVRERAEYQVTAKGLRHLNATWPGMLESSIPTDMEAILRTASLAILCGAERKSVAAYLKRAARERASNARGRKKEVLTGTNEHLGLYSWMQSVHVKARHTSEVKALRQLASALLNRKSSL